MKNKESMQLGRRQFLKAAIGVGTFLGFPTFIPARVIGAEAPSKLIRIAQIGCGRIANDMDLPGVLRHPNLARIVAVADRIADIRSVEPRHDQPVFGYAELGQDVGPRMRIRGRR